MLVHQLLEVTAGRLGMKTALVCGQRRCTYAEIEEQAARLAGALVELGIRPRDRVAILLENSVEPVISMYGVMKAGAVAIMLNAAIKPRKLNYILKDSGARLLITDWRLKNNVENALHGAAELKHIVWCGRPEALGDDGVGDISGISAAAVNSLPWARLLRCGRYTAPRGRSIDVDLAAIIYTSGSTGEPKGVMSTHANMVSAIRSIMEYLENRESDIVLNALPLAFDYGLYQVLMTFAFGGALILEKSFVYPLEIMHRMVSERVTGLPVVPTMLALLLEKVNPAQFDLSALRYVSNTAAHLPTGLVRKLRACLPKVQVFAMYGLTECKRVSYLPPADIDRKPGSVGLPIPNTQVFIMDEEGNEVAAGRVGELVVRGSNVMQGYWNAPAETAATFRLGRYRGDALLYSGDLFRRDEEGYLYFVARKDDLIKVKGERVSPKEIENMLCELEGIAEAAVFGIPDRLGGQAIAACVVAQDGCRLTREMVLKHCRINLEPFMIPQKVVFLPSLPKSPNGKIDKKELSGQLLAEEGV